MNMKYPINQNAADGNETTLNWAVGILIAHPIVGYPILLLVMSVLAFLAYGWDKRQARNNGWRVPEKQLHVLAFLGGWPGAMVGRNYFRHKTQKLEFTIMIWAAVALHVVVIGGYLYSIFA